MELWKMVAGYEGLYEVSDRGRVRSVRGNRSRVLKVSRGSNGYLTVGLYRGGEQKTHAVHRLVAAAFIGPRPEGMQVNHVDAEKPNNAAVNLEYCTPSANRAHSFALGRESTAGERSHNAKLTEAKVSEIRRRVRAGEFQRIVARDFGVTQSNVSQICGGVRWTSAANHKGEAPCPGQ